MSFYESITDNQHVLLTSDGVVMHKSFANILCLEMGYHGYFAINIIKMVLALIFNKNMAMLLYVLEYMEPLLP